MLRDRVARPQHLRSEISLATDGQWLPVSWHGRHQRDISHDDPWFGRLYDRRPIKGMAGQDVCIIRRRTRLLEERSEDVQMSQIGGVPFRPSSGYLGTLRPIWLRAAETGARRWMVSLALLLLGYFVAGIFGRFPWKADEPHSFGMIWEILEENQWLVMQIADQPFVEKPPLVYWLGALCAKEFSFLSVNESARLAVPILVTISLFALYASARRLWPEMVRWRAWVQVAGHEASDQREDTVTHASVYALLALALVAGTLGFSEQIHKLTADLGQLAGGVVALYALIRLGVAPERGRAINSAAQAGFIVSIGVGIGFLSKGLFIPGVI